MKTGGAEKNKRAGTFFPGGFANAQQKSVSSSVSSLSLLT